MSEAGSIDIEIVGNLAQVILNRPSRRNALSLEMWLTIPHIFSQISCNPAIHVVTIEGAGEQAFAAGADINELEALMGSAERGAMFMDAVERAEAAIVSCHLPTVAKIKGFCIGAGLEIAMACDLRIASDDSIFAAPPAKLGANYSHSSTMRLVQLVGIAKAKEMLFTGARVNAAEAHRIGLINTLVPRAQIDDEVRQCFDILAANSKYSIQVAKLTVAEICDGVVSESDRIRMLRSNGFLHRDFLEGVTAFRERRTPNYRDLAD